MINYLIPYRSILEVNGIDSTKFLQTILTMDINSENNYGFLLTNKGKILYDFYVFKISDDFILLDIFSDYSNEIINELLKYRFRSKVSINISQEYSIYLSSRIDKDNCYVKFDKRFLKSEQKIYRKVCNKRNQDHNINANEKDVNNNETNLNNYQNIRYQFLIPEFGIDFFPNEFFPFDLNFGDTGVCYTKGCFIGQEVVTRAKFLGNITKKLIKLEVQNISDLNYIQRGRFYMNCEDDTNEIKHIGFILGYFGKEILCIFRDSINKNQKVFEIFIKGHKISVCII